MRLSKTQGVTWPRTLTVKAAALLFWDFKFWLLIKNANVYYVSMIIHSTINRRSRPKNSNLKQTNPNILLSCPNYDDHIIMTQTWLLWSVQLSCFLGLFWRWLMPFRLRKRKDFSLFIISYLKLFILFIYLFYKRDRLRVARRTPLEASHRFLVTPKARHRPL